MTRKLIYSISLFLICASMAFCSNAQEGTVKGKVLGREGPLQSATVTIGNKTVLTDKNGEFSFALVQGNYDIAITHTSYKGITQSIKIDPGNSLAIEVTMTLKEELGEVVVLGSRSEIQRSNLNTPVPVDAFSATQLKLTGQTSLVQMLNFVAPSFNASRQSLFEPITLRGLNPDQVLILINGTRYHNMSWVNFGGVRGVLGKGSVANDMNAIPFTAIEKIEILRDGASAQYGSDAIAGVINIRLKELKPNISVNLHLGQQYKGDGENFNLGAHGGIPLGSSNKGLSGKRGFLNFSGDLSYRDHVWRRGEFTGTVYKQLFPGTPYEDSLTIRAADDSMVEARKFDRSMPSNAGTARLSSVGFLVNGSYSLNKKVELFWTSAVNYREVIFESPHFFPKNASLVNTELFPDGFKPIGKIYNWTVSAIVGVKGVFNKGGNWKFSSAYGNNSSGYYTENTNNASQQYTLGKSAPTKFYTGSLYYQQLTNNLHFTKNIVSNINWMKAINLSWGAELRFENYEMKTGEEAAWRIYDLRKRGGAGGSLIISPDDALDKHRLVAGTYIDFETDMHNRFLVNISGRYEYYNDFGGNLAGKLAGRYKLTDKLSLRASVGNGFRAPSLQQSYFSSLVVVAKVDQGGVRIPAARGLFKNDHPVTRTFGVPPLEPEKSLNLNGGFTSSISENIYLTADAYWIQVKNRIVISGNFDRTINPEVDSLLKPFPNIDVVSFFTNAINTRTTGVDVVLHGKWKIQKADFQVMLTANFTKTKVFGEIKTAPGLKADSVNTNTLFSREEIIRVEKGQPDNKVILSLEYKIGKFDFLLRNTRFGETAIVYESANPSLDESFSSRILTDFNITYTPRSWLNISAGVNNLFDVYPDEIKFLKNKEDGMRIYAMEASPFGFSGGYYFLSLAFSW